MTGWRKSTFCTGGGCVEVQHRGGWVLLRDSARPADQVRIRPADWAVFVAGVKAGEFDEETPK